MPLQWGGGTEKSSLFFADLYLLHRPDVYIECSNKLQVLVDTWKALEDLYRKGLCRAVGVSCFLVQHLEKFLPHCSIVPHVNQVEFHPYQNPQDLLRYCRDKSILVQV